MATLHKIKAYLYDNVLTEGPNDLIARASSERSLIFRINNNFKNLIKWIF